MGVLQQIRRWWQPDPEPERQVWVIAKTISTGTPMKYFCFDRNRVWRWTPSVECAYLFSDRTAAQHTLDSCDVSFSFGVRVVEITV